MRLLPLREHHAQSDQFLSLWVEYLRDYHPNKNSTDLFKHAQSMLQEGLNDAKTEYFLIDYDRVPVGFAIAYLEEECFPDEDLPEVSLHISSFYIHPEHRRQHLGKMAFKLLRQWGRDNQAALVEIEAESSVADHFLIEQGLELIGKGQRNLYRGFI